MKNIKKGGLGNDMGFLLERKEKKNKVVINDHQRVDGYIIEDIYNDIKEQPRISFWDLD